jgi:hypothetical protein
MPFFVPGRAFRQPAYFATSFSERVADHFILRVPPEPGLLRVKWLIHIDPVRKCHHVNLVERTNVTGEEEYLFAPYSAFRVRSATWSEDGGTVEHPHVIELDAAVDNKAEPEDLDLAPWS